MLPAGVTIYLALEPVDLRWSFDLLAGRVRERLGEEPRSGALFVFLGKRADRAKVLFFDRTGLCILYKRLDRGTFRLPAVIEPGATSVAIDEAELALFLEGLALPDTPQGTPRRRRRRLH
jgi:transposase